MTTPRTRQHVLNACLCSACQLQNLDLDAVWLDGFDFSDILGNDLGDGGCCMAACLACSCAAFLMRHFWLFFAFY